jgi:tetratricopeptide (TPR) repeat protein
LLEEAERARVAVRLPVGVGQYRFVHALIRETMYELVGAADRVRLHRAVGEALEVLPGDDADSRLTDLAHHFFQAAVAGDTTKALSYAERAAKLAMTKLAYEEAALHYARALALMTESGREEDIRRCQLLLALSEAEERAGKPARAKDRLLRATDIARRCGAAEELARAALGFGGFWLAFGTVDWRLVGLLEEALATLPPDSYLLRAKVMSRLALELYYSSDRSRGAALSEEAVSLARDAGDAATVANALAARRYSLWQPEAIQQRLVDAAEIVRLAEGVGNHEVALNARSWIIRDLMELGDVNAAERETAILSRRTQELRHPAYTYVMATLKTMRALLEGRFDEVEALAVEVLAEGQKVSAQRAFQTATIHLWTVYRERARRDRAVEVEGVLQSLADVGPEFLGWRCGLATLYSLIDRKADCRREVARVVERGSEELFRDIFSGTVPAAMLTEACALLEDAEHAAALYPLFARYTGRFVVAGAGGMWYGAVARYLGLLCATMSRWDDAERHFEEALELNARIGARPFLAHTQQELAAMLVARGRSEDRARARELAGQARQTANELGMVLLNERLDTLEPTLGADGAAGQARRQASVAATAAASRTGIFRLEGEFWTIAYGDGVFRLKDSAGLRYLALLLRHPGREFLVTDLADQGRGPEVSPAVGDTRQSASLGDAGEAFDERASTAYRDRLDGIRNQLAEAESFNDHARASRLREEMDFLVQELGQGLGLHGRRRRLASHTERARVNVTRRIKGAIQKVWENDPLLGSYLTASVRTGTFCSYSPDPRIGVAWEF